MKNNEDHPIGQRVSEVVNAIKSGRQPTGYDLTAATVVVVVLDFKDICFCINNSERKEER